MENKLVLRGIDLIKGATRGGKDYNSTILYDAMPWQMVNLEDKTEDWKRWQSDYFEWIGMRQISTKARKYIKNRMLTAGILDMEDYTIGGDESHTYLNNMFMEQEFVDPLKRFYPMIPSFINLLKGDFLKRDREAFVKCIDRGTEDEKLGIKMENVKRIVMADAMKKKEAALQEMGLSKVSDEEMQQLPPEQQQQAQQQNEQFTQEMSAEQKLVESQQKYKKYRHIMEEFAQLVFNKDYERMNMAELEEEAFVEMLSNAEICFLLDMKEEDYKVRFLDSAKCFHHVSDEVTYYSEGDYFGFFEAVSIGDIISASGKKLTDHHYKILQQVTDKFYGVSGSNINPRLMTDGEKTWQQPYYDATKKYPASKSDIAGSQFVQNEIINDIVDYVSDPTNTSWDQFSSEELINPKSYASAIQGKPKMFRRMVAFVKGQRKIGWLTKKNKAGYIDTKQPLWVDENFKVKEKPVYDNSLIKEKSAANLLYGEHVDWTWINEWRRFEKYTPNYGAGGWWEQNTKNVDLTNFCIYLDGEPIPNPFKSATANALTVEPPFEGRQFKIKGVRAVSTVENLSIFQILTNICVNRVPDVIADDIGLALWINQGTLQNRNTLGIESEGDPLENAMEQLRTHKVLTTHIDRDTIKEMGNSAPIAPQILNLSRIEEAQKYLGLAMQLREMAGETIGISRQRAAQPSKPGETATATQMGANYSESQTEYLYDQFLVKFMPRVYQKMIEAGTYYASKSESSRAFYQTSAEGNAYLEVENLDNPLRHYSIKMVSDPANKEMKKSLEQFFMSTANQNTDELLVAEVLTEKSPSRIIDNLRKQRIYREEQEDKKHEQQMALQKQTDEAAAALQKSIEAHETKLKQMDVDKDRDVAITRALGGLQSDNDADGNIDAMQNLQNVIADLKSKTNVAGDKLDFEKQKHGDTMVQKDKELLVKQSMKQKELAVALVNQNAKDDKTLNRKVAKKQGVS